MLTVPGGAVGSKRRAERADGVRAEREERARGQMGGRVRRGWRERWWAGGVRSRNRCGCLTCTFNSKSFILTEKETEKETERYREKKKRYREKIGEKERESER